MIQKDALVIHSGGMDSSICLALAAREFGENKVLSLSFSYSQRHRIELEKAEKICKEWNIDHITLSLDCLEKITENALLHHHIPIFKETDKPPNTLVLGRNGLMARLGAIHAHSLGARCIYLGIIEVEGSNSGYRDCTRKYMDLMQEILRIDLDDQNFEIRTPLVKMTKKETLEVAYKLGILEFLLLETITCYEGIPYLGCKKCPSCILRNEGLAEFQREHPELVLPYIVED